MDNLFGEIDCRSKSDGIVMGILRSAMDKAHEKVQSEAGSIEFLHERSKFYELAVILVESGLNILQQQTDILESNREKVISDLTEMRHWLLGRIEVMKQLINEKDRELTERIENELKLRHVLESKEREVIFLRDNLENQRTMSEGSLDLGLLVKNKGETTDSKSDSELLNEERFREDDCYGSYNLHVIPKINPMTTNSLRPEQKNVIQQMSSDIDILKETLDFAFGKKDNGEMVRVEKQWRCTIEKDILFVLIRGFLTNIEQRFKDVYKEIFKAWKEERDDFNTEVHIREDLYKFMMVEAVKDVYIEISEYSNTAYWKVEVDGNEERLIQNLDSMLKCLDSDEEEHQERQEVLEYEGVVKELEIIEWSSNDDESSTFTSVNEKLEIAMKQLSTSKELLLDLEKSIGISHDGCVYTSTSLVVETEKPSEESFGLINPSYVLMSAQVSDFHQMIQEFEINIVRNLDLKALRIDELKQQFHNLIEPVDLMKKRKLLYKKAFLARCQNLKLAETEVDLLGDQVEELLHLLKNIYMILDQNSTILSCHFKVFDVLKLIKDKLADGVSCTSSS